MFKKWLEKQLFTILLYLYEIGASPWALRVWLRLEFPCTELFTPPLGLPVGPKKASVPLEEQSFHHYHQPFTLSPVGSTLRTLAGRVSRAHLLSSSLRGWEGALPGKQWVAGVLLEGQCPHWDHVWILTVSQHQGTLKVLLYIVTVRTSCPC